MEKGALRHSDGIAYPDRVVGLPDCRSVDPDRSRRAEARGERAAFDETRQLEPLIEPPPRDRGCAAAGVILPTNNVGAIALLK
jgi:hypothetical protein